jgi:hypothetical protein
VTSHLWFRRTRYEPFFRLANSGARSQTSGIMKTLSGTFAFVVLAVIVVVTLISCPAKPAFTEQKFTLHFKEAEVPDEDAFKKALTVLKEHGGQYKLRLKHNNEVTDPYDPLSLKTDKATKSEVANRAAAGEPTASITYRVTSADPTDIEGVVKTLK